MADRVQGQRAATFDATSEVPWRKAEDTVPSQVPQHPKAHLLPVQEVQQETRKACRTLELTLDLETAFRCVVTHFGRGWVLVFGMYGKHPR